MDRQKFLTWCTVKRAMSKNSLKHTRIRFDLLQKWLNGRLLTTETAEKYVLYLKEKGIKNVSINSYIRILNLLDVFNKEKENGPLFKEPIAYQKKEKRVPTILTIEEVDAIINAPVMYGISKTVMKFNGGKMPDLNATYSLLWLFVASTGCRIEEALSIKKTNLLLGLDGHGSVKFIDTKNDHDRIVPIPPLLVFKLIDHVKAKIPTDFVFVSGMGNKIATTMAEEDLKRRVKTLGGSFTKHVYPHCFRNSYIMELLTRGTDPITIAKLVGHEDVNTTLGYTKYNMELLEKGAENHPLFSRSVSPQRILSKIEEALSRFKLETDKRFRFETTKTGEFLSFKISIKGID